MSYPKGATAYEEDGVVLAGDLSPEQVQACLAAGVRSWLYVNAATHASCPREAVEAASVPFDVVPLLTAAALADPATVDALLAHVDAAPSPLMIQCSTATRAGLPYILHKALAQKLYSTPNPKP
jgi:protein tyrosine phosphatase (PTP) superfamily phosphohydrolase (DUF442 family)